MEYLRIASEALIGFGALFLLTKILGKTQINQITAFDFISAIVLGELVGNALYDPEVGIPQILFAVTLWGLLIFSIDFTTLKIRSSRKLLEGTPSILIRNGSLQRNELKKNKLDLSQMLQLLRNKNVFSLSEVEYAIYEPSGTINVMKKHDYQQPDNQSLNLPKKEVHLPITVVADGELLKANIKEIEWDEKDVIMEITRQGHQLEDIMYGEWEKEKGLFLLPFE